MSTWLLLRGLARDRRHWGRFPSMLREALGETVHALDLPGNGERHREPSPTSIAAMREDCRARLAAAGIATPVNLVAISLGAMVAAEWSIARPAEVGAAVLINTSLPPHAGLHERLRPGAYPTLLRLLLCPSSPARAESAVLALTSELRRNDRELLAQWSAWHAQHPPSRINIARQLLAARRLRLGEAPRSVPVLVLASARDRLVAPRCSQRIARAWQCPLAIHPEAGHDLPLDDPEWVIEQIRAWRDGRRPG